MTIEPGIGGPSSPEPGTMGFRMYASGFMIYCPGTYQPGDRRTGACRHKWGRVGPGTRYGVRVQPHGEPLWRGCLGLRCPECHHSIEFLTVTAEAA